VEDQLPTVRPMLQPVRPAVPEAQVARYGHFDGRIWSAWSQGGRLWWRSAHMAARGSEADMRTWLSEGALQLGAQLSSGRYIVA
jgi:hypothetical protein